MSDESLYAKVAGPVASVAWVLTFFGAYIYCIATYGFLLGFGLGWLPSGLLAAIVAAIAGFAWPLLLIGVLAIAWSLFR